MKVKCISNLFSIGPFYPNLTYKYRDLSEYITIGKLYEVLPNPASEWVYNIIDNSGNPHDISKECFKELREINLGKLLK